MLRFRLVSSHNTNTSLDFRSLFRHLSHWQYRSIEMPYPTLHSQSSPFHINLLQTHISYPFIDNTIPFPVYLCCCCCCCCRSRGTTFYCCYYSAYNYRSIYLFRTLILNVHKCETRKHTTQYFTQTFERQWLWDTMFSIDL